MAMESLQVDISHRGQTAVFTLSGPLTAKHVATLRRLSFDEECRGCQGCVMDLTDVDEIDGYGLSALVGMLARRRGKHSKMALCGVRPDLRALFEATFCDALFPLRSTLAAALEVVGEEGQ